MKALLTSLLLFSVSSTVARAALVLTVDVSNKSAVVFRALLGLAQESGSLYANFNGGITLQGFFSQAQSIPSSPALGVSGTWAAGGGMSSFDQVVTLNFGSEEILAGRDLNFFDSHAENSILMNFSSTAVAFTGVSVLDLSTLDFFPALGTTGEIRLGYLNDVSLGHGATLGQYVIIPEMSSSAALVFGAVISSIRRRRNE